VAVPEIVVAAGATPSPVPPSRSSLPEMDIIQSCLALAPVPYLSTAFSIFAIIWQSVGQVQASNEQLEALSYSIAQLLKAIDGEYRQGRLQPAGTSTQLDDLHRFVWSNSLIYVFKLYSREFRKGY